MAARLLILIGLLWLSGVTPSHAQVPDNDIPYGNWWRGCASLDLDFYHDQYYINKNTTCDGTVGTTYSGAAYGTNVTNFITGTGATFTRAGSNVTSAAAPFYLSSIQTFVSRASVTNNVTSTFAPFYTNSSQAWVSRADGGTAKATYFDSTGTLQTAAAGTARNAAYYYNGTTWVTAAANALTPQTISSITDSSGPATVTTGAAHGLAVGNSVTLSGNYPFNYNGTFTIVSVPSSTTFTYAMATDPVVNASQVGLYTTTAMTPAVLVEPAATNGIRNNTMVGTTAGSTTQLVNNGTFGSCSGSACSGWTSTVNGGGGNVSYSSGAILTGDGTNPASIYQAITTVSGRNYVLAVTTVPGSAVTVQAGTTSGGSTLLAPTAAASSNATNFQFTATSTTSFIQINNINATTATITLVSLEYEGISPTDWSISPVVIVGSGTESGISYVDVAFSGSGSTVQFINLDGTTNIAASIGETLTQSAYLKVASGSLTNVSVALNLITTNSSGNGLNNYATFPAPTTAALGTQRYVNTAIIADSNAVYVQPRLRIVTSGAYSFTLRIGMPQLEQNAFATSVIATSGSAVTRAADVYSQQPASYVDGTGTLNFTPANTARTNHNTTSPYASLGTLIEPAATNSIRNNMTVGAVAADGVERTNNGTFSTTSPNVCSGSDISSGNSLSCSSGTAVTAQTISSITYSGTTATVTTGAAHNLTIGYIVTIAGVTGTSAASYNGSFMVVSAPSSTTFTYKMITAPTSNATVTGASYTATAGGWAGTVNGGTGTVTGSSGSMTLTGDGTNAASVYEAIPTTSVCSVDVVVTMGSGGPATFLAGTSVGASNLGSTTVASGTTTKFTLTTSGPVGYLQINNTSATAANVISVSVQSAGCPSTDWPQLNIALGLSGSVLDTGTINGVPYIDVKVTGTTTSALLPSNQNFENFSQIAASSGQTWTESCYLALISGTIPNTVNLVMAENNSSGSNIQFDASSNLSLTGTLTRYSVTKTLSNASTAYVQPAVWVYSTGVGQAVNFTLRIGMPQMEQNSYGTSVIPTFGSTVTRTADVYNQPVGTYFNSSGVLTTAANNTPRMDHSPSGNYAPQGILIEEGRTNLFPKSVLVSTGYSNCQCSITTTDNAVVSPDGGTDASQVLETAVYADHYVEASINVTAAQVMTYSFFIKPVGTRSRFYIALFSNSQADDIQSLINLNTLTVNNVGSGTGSTPSSTIQPLPNGWYRITLSGQPTTSTSTSVHPRVWFINGSTTYTGDPTQGFDIWGSQLEVAAFPTSYIPTNGSALTRQADVFTLPTSASGTNGAWYSQGVGTLLTNGMIPYIDSNSGNGHRFAEIDDGTGNNRISLTAFNGTDLVTIWNAGSSTYSQSPVSTVANSLVKGGASWNSPNNVYASYGGTSYISGSSIMIPTMNLLNLGSGLGGYGGFLDGWDRRITYFPIQHPNASLPQF